jgi:predicted transcriptional regulator
MSFEIKRRFERDGQPATFDEMLAHAFKERELINFVGSLRAQTIVKKIGDKNDQTNNSLNQGTGGNPVNT